MQDQTLALKQFVAKVEKEGNRKFQFTLSSDAVDRDNDTIDQDGIDVKEFKKNPVVLWAHDPSIPPIGKVISTWVRDGKLMGAIEFTPKGVDEFADKIHDLVEAGFLKSVSVGFLPKRFEVNEDRGGLDFKEVELLEISFTPVPSNRDALGGQVTKAATKWAEYLAGKEEKHNTPDPRWLPIEDAISAILKSIEDLNDSVEELNEAGTQLQPVPEKTMGSITRDEIINAVKSALTEEVRSQINEHTGRLD